MNPKNSRIVGLVPVLVLVLFPMGMAWAGAAQDEAKQWLERMIRAAQDLTYQGTFVYSQGRTLETMHIVHVSGENGVRQHLYSLSGAPREVVVMNKSVTCLLPKQKIIFSGANFNHSPFPLSLSRELSKLEKYYRFDIIGDDRVADRKTRVMVVKPRDELRFGYRLWLDHATGLVLRSALLNERGQIVEQLMFTDLQIKSEIDPQQWSLPPALQSVNPPPEVQHAPEAVTQSNWSVASLPEGFVQVLHTHFTADAGDHPTEHMVFTDGLATVSVFLERLNGEEPWLKGASRMGAMNAFGVVIDNYQALVVGEVPQVTVKMIADSLQHTETAPAQ